MQTITIEKLSEEELESRGVRAWPIWTKEVSRFDWHYGNPKDADSFSINEKQRRFLIQKAEEIASRPDFEQLLSDLANSRLRFAQFRRGARP